MTATTNEGFTLAEKEGIKIAAQLFKKSPETIANILDGFDTITPPNPVELMLENLQEINQQIAHLNTIKEQITWQILDNTGAVEYHMGENGKRVITGVSHEGQKTEVFGKYKATLKTDVRWKVDIDKYLVAPDIREAMNPVRMKVEYTTNKTALKDVWKYGTEEEQAIVNGYLQMEYATPSVVVALNV